MCWVFAGAWKHIKQSVRMRLIEVLHDNLTKDWKSKIVIGQVQAGALDCIATATYAAWQRANKVTTSGPALYCRVRRLLT